MFSFPVFLFTPPDSGMLGRVRWGRMVGSVTNSIKRCTFSIMLTCTYLRHSFPSVQRLTLQMPWSAGRMKVNHSAWVLLEADDFCFCRERCNLRDQGKDVEEEAEGRGASFGVQEVIVVMSQWMLPHLWKNTILENSVLHTTQQFRP